MPMTVAVVPHDPRWSAMFATAAKRIEAALGRNTVAESAGFCDFADLLAVQ